MSKRSRDDVQQICFESLWLHLSNENNNSIFEHPGIKNKHAAGTTALKLIAVTLLTRMLHLC